MSKPQAACIVAREGASDNEIAVIVKALEVCCIEGRWVEFHRYRSPSAEAQS